MQDGSAGVSKWYDIIQPVADLMHVTSSLLRIDAEPTRVQQRHALLEALLVAGHAFEQGPAKSPGFKKFAATVTGLLR